MMLAILRRIMGPASLPRREGQGMPDPKQRAGNQPKFGPYSDRLKALAKAVMPNKR